MMAVSSSQNFCFQVPPYEIVVADVSLSNTLALTWSIVVRGVMSKSESGRERKP